MRVLIFHGYLLSGTGSNVYNARLAEALVGMGHEVHMLCQDRHPERYAFIGAAGDWDGGELRVRRLRAPAEGNGSCTVYRPDIGGLLPVYVQDAYEGVEARTFARCSDAEVQAYVRANVEAVREVAARVAPELALANHLVMGPAVLARALGEELPYAIKVHGSALEYTVKPEPDRFLGYAREGLARAHTVLVGSTHTAHSLWRAMGDDPSLPSRTRLGPPGVDVGRFAPREPEPAAAAVDRLIERLRAGSGATADGEGAFARDELAAADALSRVRAGRGELVAFVGKLIPAKGIDLLIAAWPLLMQRRPQARLVVIGFGSWRPQVEALCEALTRGDLAQIEARALPYLSAFLRALSEPERDRYADSAKRLSEQVVFTGRLDHEELADVLPLCEALVVPSTFPEAFGMVAAEAAACGVLPVSAAHSGLAEVSEAIAAVLPATVRGLLSFALGADAVSAIADDLAGWLQTAPELQADTRRALVSVARERWSWQGVASGVISAALGEAEGSLARAVG